MEATCSGAMSAATTAAAASLAPRSSLRRGQPPSCVASSRHAASRALQGAQLSQSGGRASVRDLLPLRQIVGRRRLRRGAETTLAPVSNSAAAAAAAAPSPSAAPLSLGRDAAAAGGAAPVRPSDIDWDNLGFGIVPTDAMFVGRCELGGEWGGQLQPYGEISMSPSAGVLNYGQGSFEGLKSYRTEDGRVVVFRPEENARRMQEGAERMAMPAPPVDFFLDAVMRTVSANREWVPPYGKGSLYVRPLLIATGAVLGLAPAPSYSLVVYASPVGTYFKGGQLTPIDLKITDVFHRAAPGGVGGVKTICNYAQVLVIQQQAKKEGFADVIYLDAVENKYIEEVSSCNIFVVKGKTIRTPALGGTILPGITRKSIMKMASDRGYAVSEDRVSVDDVMAADEVFCTGTAVVVSPVGSITVGGTRRSFYDGAVGPVAQELYKSLTDLQYGRAADSYGWLKAIPEGYHQH